MVAPIEFPSRTELEKYRKQLQTIEAAAEGVGIPVPEIQSALGRFFEQMSEVIDSLDKQNHGRRRRTTKKSTEEETAMLGKNYLEWIINKPQADRILEHLKLLENYVESRNALRDP